MTKKSAHVDIRG